MSIEVLKLNHIFCTLFCLLTFAFVGVAQDGGVKGKIRTRNGNGIANAEVKILQGEKVLKSVRTDNSGKFLIRPVAAGKYSIRVEADGYTSGTLYNIQLDGKVVDLGDRLILSVDQGTLVIIKGGVFFKEGTSILGAKVEIEEVLANGSFKKLGNGFTTISGEFTFKFAPGLSKVRVTAKYKGASASKEIDVDIAAIYRTAITLDISQGEK